MLARESITENITDSSRDDDEAWSNLVDKKGRVLARFKGLVHCAVLLDKHGPQVLKGLGQAQNTSSKAMSWPKACH